ncbi:hypothetical protein F4777DRAFT_568565 [Nemania sp. FL0916]|nr:hypothetical protein F4777DRAFT_568565 [Nemania sp. FL0916]
MHLSNKVEMNKVISCRGLSQGFRISRSTGGASSGDVTKILWYFDFQGVQGTLGGVGCECSGRSGNRSRTKGYRLYDIFTATHNQPMISFAPRDDF